jgi:hypothetical protein
MLEMSLNKSLGVSAQLSISHLLLPNQLLDSLSASTILVVEILLATVLRETWLLWNTPTTL